MRDRERYSERERGERYSVGDSYIRFIYRERNHARVSLVKWTLGLVVVLSATRVIAGIMSSTRYVCLILVLHCVWTV